MVKANPDLVEAEPGTQVRLKSGGPNMTVVRSQHGVVICAWFDRWPGSLCHEESFDWRMLYALRD